MNSDGLGLGLQICKQIVEQNGGRIYVESEGIGKGSCFTFTMKMAEVFDQNENEMQASHEDFSNLNPSSSLMFGLNKRRLSLNEQENL